MGAEYTDISKKTNKIKFSLVAVAFIFLFNPNISIIDIIPDIIGYLVLSVVLVKLADLNEDIAQALRFFRYMIIVEVCKFLAIMWLFGLTYSTVQNTGTLLLGFTFAVVDCIILIVAFNKLFGGLITLGFVHPNTAVLGRKGEGKKSYTEKIRSFTLFFIIFKAGMSVLPEFSNLASYEYDESSGLVDIYEYIGLMRAMAFIVVFIVGLIWLVKIMRYFFRLNSDREFCEALNTDYINNVLPRSALFIRRNIRIAFSIFLLATIFMIDLRMDLFNVIPDFIGGALFLAGFIVLRKYLTIKRLPLYIVPVLYIITSIAAYVIENMFFDKYYYGAIYRDMGAYNFYWTMCLSAFASLLCLIALIALMIYAMNDIIKNHTGYIYGESTGANLQRLKSMHRESRKKLILISVGAAAAAATDIFYIFFAERFRFAGALSIFGDLLFIVLMIKATNDLFEDVETKYMLD